MACYHPIRAYRTPHGVVFSALRRFDILGELDIPCGQCLGCRLRRSKDWAVRIMHEAQMHQVNSFVTLTYSDEHLPADGSLHYVHFQAFMKRLRQAAIHSQAGIRSFGPWAGPSGCSSQSSGSAASRIRFFMCGEYGPSTLRPHYHACLFNVDFTDSYPAGKSGAGKVFNRSPALERLWTFGHSTVQPLNPQTAGYCARYVVDKVTGDAAKSHYSVVDADGVLSHRTPEFCRCSLRPGIGSTWYSRFGGDVARSDSVVVEGSESSPPRYYDKLEKRKKLVGWDSTEFAREQRAKAGFKDQTPERLEDRETVHKARVSTLKRSL